MGSSCKCFGSTNRLFTLSSSDINSYLKNGWKVTAKDIRMYVGNVNFINLVKKGESRSGAIVNAAKALGHSKTIFKNSYLCPVILETSEADIRRQSIYHLIKTCG